MDAQSVHSWDTNTMSDFASSLSGKNSREAGFVCYIAFRDFSLMEKARIRITQVASSYNVLAEKVFVTILLGE